MSQPRQLLLAREYKGREYFVVLAVDDPEGALNTVERDEVDPAGNHHILSTRATPEDFLIIQSLRSVEERADVLDLLGYAQAAAYVRNIPLANITDAPVGWPENPKRLVEINHDIAKGDLVLEADGSDYVVHVYGSPATYGNATVTLRGEQPGSLTVHGCAAAHAVRDGDGDGDVVRKIIGHGDAKRLGAGKGTAVRVATRKVEGACYAENGEGRRLNIETSSEKARRERQNAPPPSVSAAAPAP